MRPFLAQFSEPEWSGHLPSWADFITTTPVFRFSIHTSYYAGVRQFVFSLLVSTEKRSPEGTKRMHEYSDLSLPKLKLGAHRPDGLQNLRAISQISWAALGSVLEEASRQARREDERTYALRAGEWLRDRCILL